MTERVIRRSKASGKRAPKPPVAQKTAQTGKDPKTGRFTFGNHFWKVRSSHGPNPKFDNPDDLWAACCEYFEWVEDNPLYTDQIISFQGTATHVPVAKMRAMTVAGLCLFLDVTQASWIEWRKNRSDLLEVILRAEAIIYQQKFSGAAADMLNANIISRDLGLADKKELSPGEGTDGVLSKITVEFTGPSKGDSGSDE